jgi:tetratricopeptide (TPR) repeat protein
MGPWIHVRDGAPFVIGALAGIVLGYLIFGPRIPTALLLRQVEIAGSRRDSPTALRWLGLLRWRRPWDAQLDLERGWHHEAMDSPRKALAAYRAAARHAPTAEAFLGMARAWRSLQDEAAARAALERAKELDPTIGDGPP